jgi:hypothetical protein
MNEQQFGNRIRHLLNQSRLDPAATEALRKARELALSRQRPEPAPALVWADNMLGSLGGWSGFTLRILMPLLMLAAALGAVYTWQQNQRLAEIEEIDALLLTDDLPIDAYLDRNFQNWLKKQREQ